MTSIGTHNITLQLINYSIASQTALPDLELFASTSIPFIMYFFSLSFQERKVRDLATGEQENRQLQLLRQFDHAQCPGDSNNQLCRSYYRGRLSQFPKIDPHATIMRKSMEEDFRLQTSKSPTTITFSGYKKPTDRLTLMVILSLAFTSKEISSSLFACGSSCQHSMMNRSFLIPSIAPNKKLISNYLHYSIDYGSTILSNLEKIRLAKDQKE